MRKLTFIILMLFMSATVYADSELSSLFPTVSELAGGSKSWITSIAPPDNSGTCRVHSATYAYFTQEAKPLFDIPRKNVYSVNIRMHECPSIEVARALYSRFAAVGETDKKKLMSVGEQGILYVVPDKNPLMGNYYLSSLFRYVVLQVHADDGFVLMDIASTMDKRLSSYIRRGRGDITSGITVQVTKDGYASYTELVPFAAKDATQVTFTGVVYDDTNKRLADASLTVLETGTTAKTNRRGEFTLNIDIGEGEKAKLFRAFNLYALSKEQEALPSGYYKADINYKRTGETGQDFWRLETASDGTIKGFTRKISDSTELAVSGTITKDGILTLNRPCGRSVLGVCNQRFTARKAGGIFEGEWTGTGGGGGVRLYMDSFEIALKSPSFDDASFALPDLRNGSFTIAEGRYLSLLPSGAREDFELATLWLHVKTTADDSIKGLYLYGKNRGRASEFIASSALRVEEDNHTRAVFDLTEIYKNPRYEEYLLGFEQGFETDKTVRITPTLEAHYASPLPKALAKGLVFARLLSFEGEDMVSNVKLPKKDGRGDMEIELSIRVFGEIINGIELKSRGTGARTWNTYPGNVYPGLAVYQGGILNEDDGSLGAPLEAFVNNILIYADKGSLTIKDISEMEITVEIAGEKITVPVEL